LKEPDKKLIFSYLQIQDRVKELARDISKEFEGDEIVLIGVLNGAFIFLSDLVREMSIPVKIDFVRLASYGSDQMSSGQIKITKDIEQDINQRHVLIVEDIVDSGLTLDWLKQHLSKQAPASVRICALVDKKERRDTPIEIDFTGFEVKEGFLVGYGLDFNEQYRYLKDIYHLILE